MLSKNITAEIVDFVLKSIAAGLPFVVPGMHAVDGRFGNFDECAFPSITAVQVRPVRSVKVLNHVQAPIRQQRKQRFQADKLMSRVVAAVVEHDIDAAHLLDNCPEKARVGLRTDTHLSVRVLNLVAGAGRRRLHRSCVGTKVLAPQLQ